METETNTPRDDQATSLPPVPGEPPGAGASPTPDAPDTLDANTLADAIVLEASLESFPGSDAPAWTTRRGALTSSTAGRL